VVYPTETVYGLGADASNDAALERLFAAKGREAGRGVSLLVAGLDAAASLIEGPVPAAAVRAADALWPGPLTLVLPASARVAPALVGPGGGVGLRCSPDPLCAALVAALGRPVTSTSANASGHEPATSAEEARACFGDAVDVYLDGGPRPGTAVSTVVEFRGGSAYLLRVGAVDAQTLSRLIAPTVLDSPSSQATPEKI